MLRLKGLLLIASIFLWEGNAFAEDSALVRLGFLLNFARYVEWPEAALKPGAPLRFCLAPGDAEMAHQFGELAKQSIQSRLVQVKQIARPADASGCHLLYLPAETPGTLSLWIGAAQQTGALTVGDLPDLIESGGTIGLVPVGGRYRFDVNLGVARQADLRFSSQLLKLARTVK